MEKVLANTWVNPWADFLSIVCIAFLSVVLIYLFICHENVCKPPKWNGFQCGGVCKGGYLLFVILIRVRKYKKHS